MVVVHQLSPRTSLNDAIRTSRRWGILERIEQTPGLRIFEGTRTEVTDDSVIKANLEGFTAVSYMPPSRRK